MLSSTLDPSIHPCQTFFHQSEPTSCCPHILDLILPTNMAFQNNYSNHVLHISPQNPLEKGGMELSSKKKTWPAHRQRKKSESSIVSRLQIPKGDPWKIRSTTQGHILQKHNIWFVHHISSYLCCIHFFSPILDYPFPNDRNMKCHNFH